LDLATLDLATLDLATLDLATLDLATLDLATLDLDKGCCAQTHRKSRLGAMRLFACAPHYVHDRYVRLPQSAAA